MAGLSALLQSVASAANFRFEPKLPDAAPRSNGSNVENSATWRLAIEAFGSDRTLHLLVTGFNKGGLLVTWYDLEGFVPA